MEMVIKAPGRYVQGAGCIASAGEYVKSLGSKVLVTSTAGGFRRHGDRLLTVISHSGCRTCFHEFGGETTQGEIDAICASYTAQGCDVILGLGGGKTIDAARGAADQCGASLVIVPTVASNDSPCSALAVVHNEQGEVTELRVTKRSPDLVLVDTEIIAAAPVRLLVAGMGDALATWFEADACRRSGALTTAGGTCSDAALTLARLCYDTLIRYGPQAVADVRGGAVTEAVEKIVHANTFLSGIGFESGGVAAAHAVNDGFSIIPEGSRVYHGELVGFGVLCLLMLDGAEGERLCQVTDFMGKVGLPMTLAGLGMAHLDGTTLRRVSDAACTKSVMGNMPFAVTPDDVYDAILRADELGRRLHQA